MEWGHDEAGWLAARGALSVAAEAGDACRLSSLETVDSLDTKPTPSSVSPDGQGRKKGKSRDRIRTLDSAIRDSERKKEVRAATNALLKQLWDLETEERQRGGDQTPRSNSRGITLHAVLTETTRRLKNQKKAKKPAMNVPLPDLVAGMHASNCVGVMYVCVEDWVVRRSNSAMELVCPFQIMRGYAGQSLIPCIHPEDHLQLRLLREEQVHTYKPGDPLVLSVRLLRACEDRGTLVCGWSRRQTLEVSHVGRDEQYGGKLHMLFTCVLEPDALEPLTFDDVDREVFEKAAGVVTGTVAFDPQRTSDDLQDVTDLMNDLGLKERPAPEPNFISAITGAVSDISSFALDYCRTCAASTFKSLVRVNVIFGLGPDRVPWVQKATSVNLMGFKSRWRIYNNHQMSGKLSSFSATGKTFYGVTKPVSCPGGGATIGYLGFSAANPEGGGGGIGPITFLIENQFTCEYEHKTSHEKSWATFLREPGVLPDKIDMMSTKISPSDPELTRTFWSFSEPQRLVDPFSLWRD